MAWVDDIHIGYKSDIEFSYQPFEFEIHIKLFIILIIDSRLLDCFLQGEWLFVSRLHVDTHTYISILRLSKAISKQVQMEYGWNKNTPS